MAGLIFSIAFRIRPVLMILTPERIIGLTGGRSLLSETASFGCVRNERSNPGVRSLPVRRGACSHRCRDAYRPSRFYRARDGGHRYPRAEAARIWPKVHGHQERAEHCVHHRHRAGRGVILYKL